MTAANSIDNNERVDSLTRELELMRERYQKLLDAHRQLQTENSILEERILSIAESFSNENSQLEQQLIDAKIQIIDYKNTIDQLEVEKQRYKDDCNLAVRLLHQRPNDFISTASDEIQDYVKNKNELTNSAPPTPSPHSLLIPTFPPTFVTTFPSYNTTIYPTSPTNENQPTTPTLDNLRLAETLFKSDTFHYYPSTHYICSKCHQKAKYCDVSVQTSFDDINPLNQNDNQSHNSSDNESIGDIGWPSHESNYMKVQKYSLKSIRKVQQDIGLSLNAIPQMHHV